MLGLDPHMIKQGESELLESIMLRCKKCGAREACAVDLKRDPNNPVWQTYCPNASKLNGLAEAEWVAPVIANYWRRLYPQG